MNDRYRLLALGVVFLFGIGLCVQYASADRWDQPGPSTLAAEPAAHDGESVLLFGEVESVDDDDVRVSQGPLEAVVTDVDESTLAALEPGGDLQVAGTVVVDGEASAGTDVVTVVADETVIDNRGPGDRLYTYGVSVLGGLLAAGIFLRHWRIDLWRLRFVPRDASTARPAESVERSGSVPGAVDARDGDDR